MTFPSINHFFATSFHFRVVTHVEYVVQLDLDSTMDGLALGEVDERMRVCGKETLFSSHPL